MNGIPVRVVRDAGPETVYLSCARTGEAGEKLQTLKRQCRALARKQFDLVRRVPLTIGKAEELQKSGAPIADFEALLADQHQIIECLASVSEEHLAQCQTLWLAALRPNHGADAENILDCLSDEQILKAVRILEQGECPADFFPSREPLKNASGTAPTGGSASGSCSTKDFPPETSKPAA